MEIRELKTFKTVATLLSFHKAADQLNYAQSSVSAQIKSLEEELEVKLFDRLGRRIRLTEAGERLVQYADKILELEQESRAEIAGTREMRGSLTIRIPESVGIFRLPRVIGQYAARYPGVELNFITCAHDTLQKDLRKGITDLAFLLTDTIQASDLEAEVLGYETLLLVTSPGHHLAKRNKIRTRDLNGETVLLSKVDCSYRRMFERILHEADAGPKIIHSFYCTRTLKNCVVGGAGITILPRVAVEEDLAKGSLVALNWEEDELETALHMIWYRERWRPPALDAFMSLTRESLEKIYRARPGPLQ